MVHNDDLPSMQKSRVPESVRRSLEMRLAKKEGDVGSPEAAAAAYEQLFATNKSIRRRGSRFSNT